MRPIASTFVVISLSCAVDVRAQDRPVVFVHGMASHASTWQETADRLRSDLSIHVYSSNQLWSDTYQEQAGNLLNEYHDVNHPIVVGHSNGGNVAREFSKLKDLDGVLTIGTPHWGAPLITGAYQELLYKYMNAGYQLYDSIAGLFNSTGNQWWTVWDSIVEGLLFTKDFTYWTFARLGAVIGLGLGAPVVPQMDPDSSYMWDHNSSASLSVEASHAPIRAGIVSWDARNYFAGPMRAIDPDNADRVAEIMYAVAVAMEGLGYYIEARMNPVDGASARLGNALHSMAGWIRAVDPNYCKLVTGHGLCGLSDGIVPAWSQVFPNATVLDFEHGPTHTMETTRAADQISGVLVNLFHVSPRPPQPPGVEMLPNHAVRGCWNYVEWAPIYTPDPASCLTRCLGIGASACEWFENGACFVEFGNGCYVEDNFSGWYTAVIDPSATPTPNPAPPPPPPPPPAMQGNSAVRGCQEYREWSPVFTPDADACRDHCIENGADSCEWNVNGDCYVEFGNSCYVEGGFGGWYAAVFR